MHAPRAADNLTEAKETLGECLRIQDNLQCLWKLLGDVNTLQHQLPYVSIKVNNLQSV